MTIKVSGRVVGSAEYLGHCRVGGLWTPGLLVEAGITEPVLRRKMDKANWTWVSISNGHTAVDGCREQKMCQVRPQPGQLAEALLKHTLAQKGEREINSGH